MNDEIRKFLEERQVAEPLRSAFFAYCKSLYSSRYLFRSNGDTIQIFLSRMTREQVEAAWLEFISDIRTILPKVLT